MKKGISVIICTHNGATKLTETLNHLAAQQVSDILCWEIILVDNASTDHTDEMSRNLWEKLNVKNVPLTIIRESIPGKLFALQNGISKARYEYFVLCDDDNWLAPDYLQIAFDIMEANPQIGATGGQTIPATEKGIIYPSWFEKYKEGYAVGKQSAESGDITSRGHIWGAGLISRTALYHEIYRDFPSLLLLGKDKKILSTEDTEYCLRLVLKGYRLYYDASLSLKHFITPERLTLQYKDSLYENFRNAHLILEKYYLAFKLSKNNLHFFNRIRLSLITPLRLFFLKKSKEKQRTILHYLFPSIVKADPLTLQIKQFTSQ